MYNIVQQFVTLRHVSLRAPPEVRTPAGPHAGGGRCGGGQGLGGTKAINKEDNNMSSATCLIRPLLFYARFPVSNRYIIRHKDWGSLGRGFGSRDFARPDKCLTGMRQGLGGTTCLTLLVKRRFSSTLANKLVKYGDP